VKEFGLIGKTLDHSFSPGYFSNKFKDEKITDCIYRLYPINKIDEFPNIIKNNPEIKGLNVTIPYKQSIIPYLNKLDIHTKNIGAVNTIKIEKLHDKLVLTGYNTDFLGFTDSIKPIICNFNSSALILGTGGSSVAVAYALKLLGIKYSFVSRNPKSNDILQYSQLNKEIIQSHQIIINTTPLGMYPNISEQPELPYHYLTSNHLLFDLIYNPEETRFLYLAKKNGAQTKNGFEMLGIQAEYSWEIWNT